MGGAPWCDRMRTRLPDASQLYRSGRKGTGLGPDYPKFKLFFLLFLGMVICFSEHETKENPGVKK